MKIKCPLCSKSCVVFKGDADASGRSYQPGVSCDCGFSYTPVIKIQGQVGEDGWQYLGREHKEGVRIIGQKFEVIE